MFWNWNIELRFGNMVWSLRLKFIDPQDNFQLYEKFPPLRKVVLVNLSEVSICCFAEVLLIIAMFSKQ